MSVYYNARRPAEGDADTAAVLKMEIPWSTYLTARLISDQDYKLIERYDRRAEDLQASLLDEVGPALVAAFLNVLTNITKDEPVRYVLALLNNLVAGNPERIKLFHASPINSFPILLRLLQTQDWFTQDKACRLLTALLNSRGAQPSPDAPSPSSSSSSPSADAVDPVVSAFTDWLCAQLRRPVDQSRTVPVCVHALSHVLRDKGGREQFLRTGGPALLAPLLKTSSGHQTTYELCLCLWQSTFAKNGAKAAAQAGAVKGLVEVCRSAQKEKVVRVALAALRNLLSHEELGLAADMVEAGLAKLVASRQQQSWGDEDIVELLAALEEKLKAGLVELSNWDRYKKELLSGFMDWSAMHTSAHFWRENVGRFEDKEFQMLRLLLKMLESSGDAKTLAVACHDLGQIVSHHPNGRFLAVEFKGKDYVMRLLKEHADPEVRKQALLTVQKLMLTKDKLDFLQTMTPGAASA